ncbi:MAG: hypothetical protein Ct9H300mP1_29790 [Planctomycetaceae bacterium]|nr:MAG: hypothetical protein Ct9H300mP1_29790 [Planctomycetaceae bacterium]
MGPDIQNAFRIRRDPGRRPRRPRLYVYYKPERAIPEHIRLVHPDQTRGNWKEHATEVAFWGAEARLSDWKNSSPIT